MTAPRSITDFLASTMPGLSLNELAAIGAVTDSILQAIGAAEQLPPSLDRRAAALTITKLQEAEHWCLEMIRTAAKRPADPEQRA